MRLIRTKGGVDAALEYAKAWSRYAKELLAWTDKRANYGKASSCPAPDGKQDPHPSCLQPSASPPAELEFAKNIVKIAEAGKVAILQQVPTLPQSPTPRPPSPSIHTLKQPCPPQSQMPLQYIYTLFLEHDLSLGALAMETVARQKRDYYQVSAPPLPQRKLHAVPFRRKLRPRGALVQCSYTEIPACFP